MTTLKDIAYDKNASFIVALDGPSASGKGLIGSMLAEEFGLKYVQSGLVYRGLAYLCLTRNILSDDVTSVIKASEEFSLDMIKGIDLNQEEIASFASKISTISKVRTNLSEYLVHLVESNKRIIMEGRDIGTVIAPNADLKIFITADVTERARRRFNQLQSEGKKCMLSDILQHLKERDARDASREVAPLLQAEDAVVIDTTKLTPAEVLQNIKNFVGKS